MGSRTAAYLAALVVSGVILSGCTPSVADRDTASQQSRGPVQQLDVALTTEQTGVNVAVRPRGTERTFEAVTPAAGFTQEIRATSSHLVRIHYPIGYGVGSDDESQVDEMAFRGGTLTSTRIEAPPGYAFSGSELEIYGDRAYAVARKGTRACLASWKLGDDRTATIHDCYSEGLEHLTAGTAGLTARVGGDGETGKTIALVGNPIPESLSASIGVYPMAAGAFVVDAGGPGTESQELRLVDSAGATTIGTIARDTRPVACAGTLWYIGIVDGASSS